MSSSSSQAGNQAQINAFGLANLFLNTKSPRATLWRTEHTPLTHFSYGDVRADFNQTAQFGGRARVEIDRPADLLVECNLRWTLRPWVEGANVAGTFPEDDPDNNYFYTDDVGNAAILQQELIVGNSTFDRSDGTWNHIYDEACKAEGLQTGLMTGKIGSELGRIEVSRFNQDLIVPIYMDLLCWPGKAIEAVAIFKQKITMQFEFRTLAQLIRTTGTASVAYDAGLANPADPNGIVANGGSNEMQDAHLQCHFVWLTSGERSIILAIPSMTLYREIQRNLDITKATADTQIRFRAPFNNCANDLFFVCRLTGKNDIESADATQRGFEWFDFSGPDVTLGGAPPVVSARPCYTSARLVINNQERYSVTSAYASEWLAQNHYPRSDQQDISRYPFGRHPCAEHPQGSLNMSMLDHQDFYWNFDPATPWDGTILLYVRAWNIATRAKGILHKELQSQ